MSRHDIALHHFSPERPPALVLGDLTLIRPLGEGGIPVIAATTDPVDIVLRSRHVSSACVLPGFDDVHQDESAARLLDLGARLHGALGRKIPLFYGTDAQLDLLYRYRRELSAHFLFLLNDEDVAWSLLDKESFYRLCEVKQVLAPRTLRPTGDIAGALAGLREPILVKPHRKSGWGGLRRDLLGGSGKARVFDTRAALLAHPDFRRLRDEVIVQEHIPSSIVDLVSFHGLANERGGMLAWFCGRNLRTYPAFAGESAFVETTDDAAVAATGHEVARKLGLKGPFKIDFVRDARDGKLYTLEVNARYTLWSYVGASAGVNLPRIAYEYLVDRRTPPSPPRAAPGHRWLDLYRDFHAFKEQDGGTALAWLGSIAGPRTCVDTCAWDDLRPFLWWAKTFLVRKVTGRALRDVLSARSTRSGGRPAAGAPGAGVRR